MPGQATEDSALVVARTFVQGVCVDVDVGFDRFKRTLEWEDVGVKPEDVPEIYERGKKRLMPKKVMGVFDSIASQARREVEFYSLRFPIKGIRFVPHRALPHLLEILEDLKKRFTEAVKKFIDDYDVNRREMLHEYKEHRAAIEKVYPTAEAARDSFYFEYKLFALSMPPELEAKALDAVTSEEARHKVESTIRRKQEDMVKSFDDWAVEIVKEARTAALTLFKEVKDKVDHGDVVHTKTIEALRDFVDRFRLLNVVGDRAVDEALQGAKNLLDPTMNTTRGREAFGEAAKAVISAASKQSDVSAVTGSYRRRLLNEE